MGVEEVPGVAGHAVLEDGVGGAEMAPGIAFLAVGDPAVGQVLE